MLLVVRSFFCGVRYLTFYKILYWATSFYRHPKHVRFILDLPTVVFVLFQVMEGGGKMGHTPI